LDERELRTVAALVVAERDERVDPNRAAGRQVARQQGHSDSETHIMGPEKDHDAR